MRTHNASKKMGQCQCTDPFGWTVQPAKTPTPVPSEGRFQASPSERKAGNVVQQVFVLVASFVQQALKKGKVPTSK